MRTPGAQAVLSAWLLVSVALSSGAVSAPPDGGSSVAGAPAEQQSGKTHLGPWLSYKRTRPVKNYWQDPNSSPNPALVITGAIKPYVDPDFHEALLLPSPLERPEFASRSLIIIVNKSATAEGARGQTMRVYERGLGLRFYWNISTGSGENETPSGVYVPKSFSSRHWSEEHDAPMLWSVFFHEGMAFHSSMGTRAISLMGKMAASHGCIRLEDYRAEVLFHLIGHHLYPHSDMLRQLHGGNAGTNPVLIRVET